jgi:putative ABC transport system ATP-binding protein
VPGGFAAPPPAGAAAARARYPHALLLADEPTGNLDSQMARGVMELLEEINAQGTTIVMVTHDPELAARAQRNIHIMDGVVTDISAAPALHAVTHAAVSTSA